MRIPFLILFLFSTSAFSRQLSEARYHTNKQALVLNDSACMEVVQRQDYNKAIIILNEAIKVDSNCKSCYANLLNAHIALMQFSEALTVSSYLIKIDSMSAGYYAMSGMLCDVLGDTISSKPFYEMALHYTDIDLHKMKNDDKNYNYQLANKGVYLIMAGNEMEGNKILEQIEDSQDKSWNVLVIHEYMNKSKSEIINELFNKEIINELFNKMSHASSSTEEGSVKTQIH